MPEYAQQTLERYKILKSRNHDRDARMTAIHLVRTGRSGQVFRGMFPEDWPQPIIANTIDIAAQDTAESVGVLPTMTAFGDSVLDESKRNRADKITKVVNAYVQTSSLGNTMISAADHLVSYGMAIFRVEPNYDLDVPFIHVDDPRGAYVERDRFLNVTAYARTWRKRFSEIVALYPEVRGPVERAMGWNPGQQDPLLECLQFFDEDGSVRLMLPEIGGLVLDTYEHPLQRVPVCVAGRPSIDGELRGAYDDAIWVWAARAKLALLSLEATQKAVEAPIAIPSDVQEFALGPDALIRSQTPEKIRRVALELPQSALIADRNLEGEVREAARHPEIRSGNTDASVVTGRGIQALMGGFDSRIKVYQSVLSSSLSDSLSMALELDEVVWPDQSKELIGSNNGTPYTIKYTPARDIKGNYGVSFEHGVMAGLDPNRALIWSLQALGAGLTSKSFVRRNLPVSMDINEEERVIDVEKLRDSVMSAIQAYAQAIPQMAATGEDASAVVKTIADLVSARKKGTPIEEAAAAAFAPPPPPEPADPMMQGPSPLGESNPDAAVGGLSGNRPVASQLAARRGERPPMTELLAQLSGNNGQNVSSARTVRTVPA